MQIKSFCHFVVMMLLLTDVAFAKTSTVYVNPNQPQFTIKLDSNRTTGYSWSLKNYDKKLISLVSHAYIAPNSKLIGAPGYETWVFKANPSFLSGSKSTKVTLDYARPWEHGMSVKTAVYKIVSKK